MQVNLMMLRAVNSSKISYPISVQRDVLEDYPEFLHIMLMYRLDGPCLGSHKSSRW